MAEENSKGQFNSNFGFLMAALGSAVGLGNLWSFPYKLGMGGGFTFLLLYIILAIVVGYPIMLTEIAIGRKTRKGAIEAFDVMNPKYKIVGIGQTIVPFFLICFYCTFGGYIIKYLWASIVALFDKNAALNTADPGVYFENMIGATLPGVAWMTIFLVMTVALIIAGVSGGIEKFCTVAMPALFFMIIIIVIRSCTLPGAGAGLEFLFKPDFSRWSTAQGLFDDFKLTGSQMFFSMSLCSGCIMAYGSYLGADENLEKDAFAIVIGDSAVAILASMAIMPAVFAFGMEPSGGPGLLFVSMTAVFQGMGAAGRFFQLIFWLLVFFSALSSSIGMMEGGVSSVIDIREKKGKTGNNRVTVALTMAVLAFIGNFMTTADALGGGKSMTWFHILGQSSVLDVWDAIAEGILMPLTGLIMAILIGWPKHGWLDDEIGHGREFKTKKFYNFCIKWIGPIMMALVVYGQLTSFWG